MTDECPWCRGTGRRAPRQVWTIEKLRELAAERERGDTWAVIGERHGITWQRAQQLVGRAKVRRVK